MFLLFFAACSVPSLILEAAACYCIDNQIQKVLTNVVIHDIVILSNFVMIACILTSNFVFL